MGLDIYLSSREASEANKRHYAICDEDEDGNYPAKSMSDEERKAHEESHPRVPHVGIDSSEFPEHYFKRTYLRSSYNDSGFNSVVTEMLGADRGLYWIFEPLGRDWREGGDDAPLTATDIPALHDAAKRARSVAADLETCDRFSVITVSHNPFSGLSKVTDDDALAIFRAERVREPAIEGWYSNGKGEFFTTEPPTIHAAVLGVDALGAPGVHLIYQRANADWYVQAAQITAEFCEQAVELIERDGACEISWSG